MGRYKNYLQRLLESQTIYKGTDLASPSIVQKNGGNNLGSTPGDEGVFASQAGERVWDNMEEMLSYQDRDSYNLSVMRARAGGPAVNEEIQQLDSEFRKLYWKTEPLVAGDPVLTSKLLSFARAQSRLNKEWLYLLRDFSVCVNDLEHMVFKYRSIYSELLKFNASLL
jgi:hypothetical protein